MPLKKIWDQFSHSIHFPVLVYSLFGVAWITLSDGILLLMIPNREMLSQLQTWKGWFFILVTSILLFYLIKRYRRGLLEKDEEKFRILNQVPIPVIIVSNKGRIRLINRIFTETFGYTLKEIFDLNSWFNAAYPDQEYRDFVKKCWEQYIQIPQDQRDLNAPPVFRVRDFWRKDRTVEFYTLPVSGGELVVCKDITYQKKTQEEINQSDKMRALGQLAGGIAHDFNNQLSAIMGYTDLLNEYLPSDSNGQSVLESIIEASETAASLTRQLLTFGRKTSYALDEIDFRDNITALVPLVERTFPKNIQLELQLNSPSHHVKGNASQLQNLLLNLILNAKDSMDDGGIITVETSQKYRETETINGLPLEGGDYLVLSVTDQGKGISGENQQKIFEPFFTTKDKNKGTGLGLSMVYRTLEIHKGAIDLEASSERGSCFMIMLPLAHSRA